MKSMKTKFLLRDRATFLNRDWRINHLYKIIDKKRRIIQFRRNSVQKYLVERLTGRDIILKGRQHGITTQMVIEMLDNVLFLPNYTAAIIAHRKEDLQKIFNKVRIAFEYLPTTFTMQSGEEWEKPIPQYDSKNELYFPKNNSRIYVALELRGDTINHAHISEAAFIKDAENKMAATLEAVPEMEFETIKIYENTKEYFARLKSKQERIEKLACRVRKVARNGIITIESTANGATGWFHDAWNEAEDGENEFKPHFLGWQMNPEYESDPGDDFKLDATDSAYKSRHELTDRKMSWYLKKRKRLKAKMPQEYPTTADEAFLHSGRSALDLKMVKFWPVEEPMKIDNKILDQILDTHLIPPESKFLVRTFLRNNLHLWRMPKEKCEYVIGGDVSEGIEDMPENGEKGGSDWSVLQVIRRDTIEQCAQFRAKIDPSKLHLIAIALGHFFNFAVIGVENNNHGISVVQNLDASEYPKELQFVEEITDHKTKKKRKRLGWKTDLRSRPILLDHFAACIADDLVLFRSKILQKECTHFIIRSNGKSEADDGYHDDTILATGIALQMILRTHPAIRKIYTANDFGL